MIVLEGPNGMREVDEGLPYRLLPGEKVIGSNVSVKFDEFDAELTKQGVQWGEVIAWTTHKMGFTTCPPCEARRLAYNEGLMNGIEKTVGDIKRWLSQKV